MGTCDTDNGVVLNLSILPYINWSDFLACQKIWILNPIWSKTQTKSGISSCIAPNAGLARCQQRGGFATGECHQEPQGSGIQKRTDAPDQGATLGNPGCPTGKQRGRESKLKNPFHSIPPSLGSVRLHTLIKK